MSQSVSSDQEVRSGMSVRTWPRRAVIFLIELYRTWISPMRMPTCRFEPSCSTYAVEALTEYGVLYGGWLSVVRLLKCGPWHSRVTTRFPSGAAICRRRRNPILMNPRPVSRNLL